LCSSAEVKDGCKEEDASNVAGEDEEAVAEDRESKALIVTETDESTDGCRGLVRHLK